MFPSVFFRVRSTTNSSSPVVEEDGEEDEEAEDAGEPDHQGQDVGAVLQQPHLLHGRPHLVLGEAAVLPKVLRPQVPGEGRVRDTLSENVAWNWTLSLLDSSEVRLSVA